MHVCSGSTIPTIWLQLTDGRGLLLVGPSVFLELLNIFMIFTLLIVNSVIVLRINGCNHNRQKCKFSDFKTLIAILIAIV